ncbi:MAG: hypothetical protein JRF64_05435 [Deltaproteobacteria bacterium]|nr:hypothetical protein [Deltaproteobacteria bacterium]
MDECANNQCATARCRPEAEADNRVVAEGEDGYFSGTAGPSVTTSHLKNVDQGSGQGAGRRKSAAYTVVCEHFEPTRNAAMGTQTHF